MFSNRLQLARVVCIGFVWMALSNPEFASVMTTMLARWGWLAAGVMLGKFEGGQEACWLVSQA